MVMTSEFDGPGATQSYGGATSFADAEAFEEQQGAQREVAEVMATFYALMTNIGAHPALSPEEKAVAMSALTDELQQRLAPAAVGTDEGEQSEPTTTDPGSVMVFKDNSNEWRWVAVHSNKYEDRAKEIFPESAHKEFVDHVWKTKEFPALRLWHIPVDIGRADFIDYDTNGFVVSSGHFNAGQEAVAARLAGMKGLGCSHGYLYRRGDLQGGVYKAYRSYEVSVLPVDRAANTLTAFFADSEVPMLTEARKSFLIEVMGEERAASIEHGVEQLARIAGERGLSYKSLEEALLDNVRETSDAAPTEKCEECGDEIPKGDIAAHMQDVHNNAGAKDDVAAAPEVAAPAAPEAESLPADAATPTDDERAAAQEALAAAGAAGADDGQKDDLVSALRSVLAESIAQLAEEVRGLKALTETQAQEIAVLKGERAAEIADMIRPRVGVDVRSSGAASSSDNNVIDPEVARKVKDAVGRKDAPASPVSGYLNDALSVMQGATGLAALPR